MSEQLNIAIAGAGPGGLTLARILHNHGIAAAIFEREGYPAVRPQGGSLDMHVETGQYAIKRAGLNSAFQKIARYEDQEFRVYDKSGALRFLDESNEGDRPEVDRGHLRQMLLDSLPPQVIRWGHELKEVEAQADGRFTLLFKDGTRAEGFDLVVGADGAWSRVRPLVSDVRPVYSGVSFVELSIPDADTRYPQIARLVGHGLMFALGDSKAIIGHRDADAHVGVYAGFRVPETAVHRTRANLEVEFAGWADELRQVIRCCDEGTAVRPIYALPIGHRWENRCGVTLLGDAAHLMSPFSGEGANLAMRDGADLAFALIEGGSDWTGAVKAFEEKMFARAEVAAVGAREGLEDTFSENGLAHLLKHVRGIENRSAMGS